MHELPVLAISTNKKGLQHPIWHLYPRLVCPRALDIGHSNLPKLDYDHNPHLTVSFQSSRIIFGAFRAWFFQCLGGEEHFRLNVLPRFALTVSRHAVRSYEVVANFRLDTGSPL